MVFRPSFAHKYRMNFTEIEKRFAIQTDPLYHYYLICAGIITLSITAIKVVVPSMPFPQRLLFSLIAAVSFISVSLVFVAARRLKIAYRFRIVIWLAISITLITSSTVDLLWV